MKAPMVNSTPLTEAIPLHMDITTAVHLKVLWDHPHHHPLTAHTGKVRQATVKVTRATVKVTPGTVIIRMVITGTVITEVGVTERATEVTQLPLTAPGTVITGQGTMGTVITVRTAESDTTWEGLITAMRVTDIR